MKRSESPYKAHLFVCVKSRGNGRKSCGDAENPELKTLLKAEVKKRGWKPVVRISEASCLGVCEAGPNIMIYPQKTWFSEVGLEDVPEILQTLESFVS